MNPKWRFPWSILPRFGQTLERYIEQVDVPIADDIMIPQQYFGKSKIGDPIRNLQLAVLSDAINSIKKWPEKKVGLEAKAWIDSEDSSHAFSFLNICESLEIEPTKVRESIGRYKLAGHHASHRKRLTTERMR